MLWVWIWLGVVVVSLIVEFVTFELVTVWFALGGIVALIMAACGVMPLVHVIVFSVVSLCALLGLRGICMKALTKNKADTNTDLIIGKSYKLLTDITPTTRGTIKVNDIVWDVKTADDKPVTAGTWVVAQEISGNKIIVSVDNAKAEQPSTKVEENVAEVQEEVKPKQPTRTTKTNTQKTTKASTQKTAKSTTAKATSKTAKTTSTKTSKSSTKKTTKK